MNCESNYQINVPSNQTIISLRKFSTNSPATINKLEKEPWWVTGFTVANASRGIIRIIFC
jgi:hypothetical protein